MISVDNFFPNEYVLSTVLCSYSSGGLLHEGRQCNAIVLRSGLVFHQYVKNALVSFYTVSSVMEGVLEILKSVPGLDNITYNSVLKGFLDHGYTSEALDVFSRMLSEGSVGDSICYVNVFGLCARLKDLKLGQQVHCRMVKSGLQLDVFLSSAIMDMYGKCGEILGARYIFYSHPDHNVVSWTTILAANFQNEFFEEALKLFLQMELQDVVPNEYTFAVLLNSCAGLSALGCGKTLHARIEKTGHGAFVVVGNALINMYFRSGHIEAARALFSNMMCRHTVTWNLIISGFSHHGLGEMHLQQLVQLFDLVVGAFDGTAGEAVSMRVDLVECSDGQNRIGILSHKRLSRSVGIFTAAFVLAILEGSTKPGVWFPEEGSLDGRK
ncbi:hypothetical protein K7X08_025445 [Anisodus acutangulus]|uniref:Pentatricopeptide repeat-containing protein n=1 Tax=Anisodus acutangulus TaxID=402998 RepID=A0A9Q1R777_9SOLA|nr:hypothetical protein K7X08_025445 [Anisodus acutangulus]